MGARLDVSHLAIHYGRSVALQDVDLVAPPGAVTGILGPNGAGKSSLLRAIAGLVAPTTGAVQLDGERIDGRRPNVLARSGVCLIPEGRGILPSLTVEENLRLTVGDGDVLHEVFDRFGVLRERLAQPAGTLSGGEQQMLALARALMTNTRILLLDEISMGLAPKIVSELYELVGQLAQEGISILLVEQFARTVLGVADIAVIMLHGRVTATGTPDEIAPELEAAYLGAG